MVINVISTGPKAPACPVYYDYNADEIWQGLGATDPKTLVNTLKYVGTLGEHGVNEMGYGDCVAGYVNNASPDVAAAAMSALGTMGPYGAEHSTLIGQKLQLTSESSQVQVAALNSLAQFGKLSASLQSDIVGYMEDTDEQVRCAAICAAGNIGAEGQVDRLGRFLGDPSPHVVAAACQSLGALGIAGATHADEIVRKLDDDFVRHAAIAALADFGESVVAKNLNVIIEKCLPDRDGITRMTAVTALGSAANALLNSTGSLQRLKELLESQDPGIRCAAALTVGKLGPDAAAKFAEALEPLLEDAEEDDSWLSLNMGGGSARPEAAARKPKAAAVLALGTLRSTRHVQTIAGMLKDPDYEVNLSALEALQALGETGCEFSQDVSELLDDDVYLVRAKAAQTLGVMKAEDDIGKLPELFEDKAPSVRIAALDAMAELGEEGSEHSNEVFICLGDKVGAVRMAALRCLGCMGEAGRCYAGVIARMLTDSDAGVRAATCETLGKLGPRGAAFADEIAMCLQDQADFVRESAAAALGSMGRLQLE